MVKKGNPHHLVMGELTDFLTGEILADTHDERYRQKISRYLVETCGFSKKDISSNIALTINAGDRKASLKIDFIIKLKNKNMMLIKYAPGSLVTRRLSTLALSRVFCAYQIPYAVITNGEDAEIIDGISGKVISQGLENIPDKKTVEKKLCPFSLKPVEQKRVDQASKIAFACEIDGACPCDSDVCVIE